MKRILFTLMAFALMATVVQAGHIDLPVKWSQLPEMGADGQDIRAEHPWPPGGQVVADDFECTSPLPIVAIRWWGSYLADPGGEEADAGNGRMLPFELSWHHDDLTPENGESEPKDPPILVLRPR